MFGVCKRNFELSFKTQRTKCSNMYLKYFEQNHNFGIGVCAQWKCSQLDLERNEDAIEMSLADKSVPEYAVGRTEVENDFIYIVEHSEVCNFADDKTIFSCDDTFDSVASNLEQDMSQAISWFKTNQMVANPSKFQVMLLGLKTDDSIVLDIGNVSIDVVSSIKLLGITIDSKLKFDQHLAKLCQKANNKISAFSRISH